MNATDQAIDGDMLVDDVSSLNLYLKDGSTFTGSINPDGAAGEVYVEIASGSKWVLTSDAHIASLTCDTDAIDLNGHTLYVGDEAYEEGTASTGEAIAVEVSSTNAGGPGDGGQPPAKPGEEGNDGQGGPGNGGEPPAKPDGDTGDPGNGGEPPAKPGEKDGSSSSDASEG